MPEGTRDDELEPVRPYGNILGHEIETGTRELERKTAGLFISGLSAGLDVGFSLFLMAVILTATQGTLRAPLVELLAANSYAIGFVFVVLGRSELFTEHTTRAVFPVLAGRARFAQLVRLWAVLYVANLAGAFAFAYLASRIGPALGVIEPHVFGEIGHWLVGHPGWVILLSGLLAGWLMGLLSWLVSAGRDTIGQIVVVWLVTSAIGMSRLHHCIVGSVEVLAGLFAGQGISWADYGHFLFWSTVGNAAGGVIFVSLIKYGHATRQKAG